MANEKLRAQVERLANEYELRAKQREASPSWEFAAEDIRAVLAAAPLPSEPCPGCEICVGEIDDCGCVIGHEHTCAPLPSDTPADGLDVCDCEPEHVWPCATIPRCDEPGCERETSCGFPTPAGYRRTCGDHYRSALALTQEPRSGDDR